MSKMRMDEITIRVLIAEAGGGWVRGRPRLGWMDGLKVALGNRGMMVEASQQCTKDQKGWRALAGTYVLNVYQTANFCLAVFFRTALPRSGGHHLEMGVMPLNDAVGINCKKGTTTENQGAVVKYMG